MIEGTQERELVDRLSLIEAMIAEGRHSTESWGWSFVLWGLAYYVAIAWATWGQSSIAWPVTMIAAGVLTYVIGSRKGDRQPETTAGRAIGAVWAAVGTSLFLLMGSASMTGKLEPQFSVAVIAAMLATANAASSILLKWKAQFAAAVLWWATAILSCFVSVTQSSILFLVAIFFGQIVFGGYMMILEARERKGYAGGTIRRSGASHV